jgi:hypothetical protein
MTTTLRLAAAGSRVDGLRVALTAAGSALATLALLAAVTVAAIGPGAGPYTSDLLNQGGLHPGVVLALVALCGPTLVLLGQCARIGAPARDRRLAALRLAGATPADVTRVVALGAGLGALPGTLLGVGVFFGLRAALDRPVAGAWTGYQPSPGPAGDPVPTALRLPTDVVLPWGLVLAVAVAVPALVTVATLWGLRRVAFTPFGVVRPTRTRPPRLLPLGLLGAGLGVVAAAGGAARTTPVATGTFAALVLLGAGGAVAGLLAGQGALTHELGRRLAGRTSSPALLLAARRMVADPFAATRATAVLSVAVVAAAGARHLRAQAVATRNGSEDFYLGAYRLVDLVLAVGGALAVLGLLVAAAEGLVARRRTYASVVAAGTPRGVVGRAVLAEVLLPLVPALLAALVVGTVAAVGLFGRTTDSYDAVLDGPTTATVGVDWAHLATVYVLALAAAALTTSLSLLFLRSATHPGELRTAA